jgi:predicted nucleic acid-binding protein
MRAYVVDTSILIQHFVEDADTEHVDRLFDQLGPDVTLYLPEICLTECANVLWKRARFHGLPNTQAGQLLNDLLALPLQLLPTAPALGRALEIGLADSLAIYDSVYIALAETLGVPLITADAKQAAVASRLGILVQPIADI